MLYLLFFFFFFFFNDTATTEIYTLSLHDALPISRRTCRWCWCLARTIFFTESCTSCGRSEEHTSELQSRSDLVCRLLLEKQTAVDTPLSAHSERQLQGPATRP